MSKNEKVSFTKKQILYLIEKTGAKDADEAMDILTFCFSKEHVEHSKMPAYVNKLMEKDGVK